jgi:hypothetical protein
MTAISPSSTDNPLSRGSVRRTVAGAAMSID